MQSAKMCAQECEIFYHGWLQQCKPLILIKKEQKLEKGTNAQDCIQLETNIDTRMMTTKFHFEIYDACEPSPFSFFSLPARMEAMPHG